MPVEKIRESNCMIRLEHPAPSYSLKRSSTLASFKRIRSLMKSHSFC